MSVVASRLEPAPMDLDADGFAALTGANPSAMAHLERYRSALEDWNTRMNLVGPATMPAFWNRHALDSAQLIPLAPDALTWADLGSGAGLPGIVLAILGRHRPGFHVHLVESMLKRGRFLAEMVSLLDLPATLHTARAEDLKLSVDIVAARACAPLTKLLSYAKPYLDRGAEGLFLKGQDVAADMAEAERSWTLDAEVLESVSDPRGRIVRVRSLKRGR